MLKSIDHIGIAVESIEDARRLYDALGLEFQGIEEIPEQGVRTAFFNVGGIAIELLEATSDESPIAKFIQKRGPGIHHIAYATECVEGELERLKGEGLELIDEKARGGAHESLVAFLHPRSTGKVLIELCQKKSAESR